MRMGNFWCFKHYIYIFGFRLTFLSIHLNLNKDINVACCSQVALDIELWDYIISKVLEFNQGALFFSHIKVAALFVH